MAFVYIFLSNAAGETFIVLMKKAAQSVHILLLHQCIAEVVKCWPDGLQNAEADGFHRPPLRPIMDRSQNVPMNTIRSGFKVFSFSEAAGARSV